MPWQPLCYCTALSAMAVSLASCGLVRRGGSSGVVRSCLPRQRPTTALTSYGLVCIGGCSAFIQPCPLRQPHLCLTVSSAAATLFCPVAWSAAVTSLLSYGLVHRGGCSASCGLVCQGGRSILPRPCPPRRSLVYCATSSAVATLLPACNLVGHGNPSTVL